MPKRRHVRIAPSRDLVDKVFFGGYFEGPHFTPGEAREIARRLKAAATLTEKRLRLAKQLLW